MRISRLRVRLAAGFALAFAIGLAVVAAGGLVFLSWESTRRFDARLAQIGTGLTTALSRELAETPDSSLRFVAGEVEGEWPANGEAFLLLDSTGAVLASRDPRNDSARVLAALPPERGTRVAAADGQTATSEQVVVVANEPDLRGRLMNRAVTIGVGSQRQRVSLHIVPFGSTEAIEADTERLGVATAIGAPLILLASLLVGYLLAGRALAPVRRLSSDIADIAPTDLSRRLAPQHGDDELGALAAEFDRLLVRLEEAQQRNQQFVREAAHQIRTPLTLVLGEAELALHATAPSAHDEERLRTSLHRVRTAAEQMRRRVDELFLLAEARAGEVVHLEQLVELDGLVLECTDLMRARASSTGHAMEIRDAEPVSVQGNGALLREALMELIENACRHATGGSPISVSCRVDEDHKAILEVRSRGSAFNDPVPTDHTHGSVDRGMGLSIVRWVATSHRGQFHVAHSAGDNVVQLVLPALSSATSGKELDADSRVHRR